MTSEGAAGIAVLTCGLVWGREVSQCPGKRQPGELWSWGISLPGECGLFSPLHSRKRRLGQNWSGSHLGVHSHFFREPLPPCRGTPGCSAFRVRRGGSSFWPWTGGRRAMPSQGWKQTATIKIPPADFQMSEQSLSGLTSDLYKIDTRRN